MRIAVLPLVQGPEEILVGGQAVIEGVMMRSPHSYAVAVRRPTGSIAVTQDFLRRPSERYPWLKYPILRGLGTLGQAMALGIRALRYSAQTALEDPVKTASPEQTDAATSRNGQPGEAQGAPTEKTLRADRIGKPEHDEPEKKKELPGWVLAVNITLSLGFFVAFYKLLPLYMATKLQGHYGVFHSLIAFNFLDGIIRIALFLAFLALLAQSKDIQRVFEYHGAEHKVVWAFEKTGRMDVATARDCTRFHPRCGTSFLLVVMVIAMLVYMVLPFESFVAKLVARIALLPVIAGLSYEFIRFAAKSQGAIWKWASQPGLWLQRITTREPDDSQLETAVKALETAMDLEKSRGGELVIA